MVDLVVGVKELAERSGIEEVRSVHLHHSVLLDIASADASRLTIIMSDLSSKLKDCLAQGQKEKGPAYIALIAQILPESNPESLANGLHAVVDMKDSRTTSFVHLLGETIKICAIICLVLHLDYRVLPPVVKNDGRTVANTFLAQSLAIFHHLRILDRCAGNLRTYSG